MKAIILAAGYATRLYPLTKDRAKPLLPVQGRPIIDYLVDHARRIPDLDAIKVVSNDRFSPQFEAWASQRGHQTRGTDGRTIPIHVLNDGTVSQEDRLGAIGDMQFCIDHFGIDDDLLVLAGDTLFTGSLFKAWEVFREHGQDLILASPVSPGEDPSRFAIAQTDADGLVQHLEEKPKEPKSNLAVFALYFYRRDTVPMIRQYLAAGHNPDAPGHFPVWLYQRKPVRVHLFEGDCVDIGTPQAYQEVMTTFPASLPDEHV